jgi:hypothetical protein
MPLQTAGSLGVHAIVRANRVEQRYGHSNDPNDCSHFHGKLVDSIFTDYSDTLAGLDGQRDITHGRGQHSVTLERDGEAINLEQGVRHDQVTLNFQLSTFNVQRSTLFRPRHLLFAADFRLF